MAKYLLVFCVLLSISADGERINNADQSNLGWVNYMADSGGDDTYAGTIAGVTAYSDGQEFLLKVATQNTGACTVNFGGGVKSIKKSTTGGLADPADGDVRDFVRLVYSSAADAMVIVGGAFTSGSSGPSASGSYWEPFHGGAGTNFAVSPGGPGALRAWRIISPFTQTLTKVSFSVITACSATCGVVWGIYSNDGATLVGWGRGTYGGSPDMGTTGAKTITLTSNASLTAGTSYIIVVGSDSSAILIAAWDAGSSYVGVVNSNVVNFGGCANSATGTGASLTLPSTCGTVSSGSATLPPVMAWAN